MAFLSIHITVLVVGVDVWLECLSGQHLGKIRILISGGKKPRDHCAQFKGKSPHVSHFRNYIHVHFYPTFM